MRILLAEHHSQVLRALRTLIFEKTEHTLVGEVMDWDCLLKQAKSTTPDLILLDWDLLGENRTDHLADLNALKCPPKLIVLSSQAEVKEKALNAGADAYVSKGEPPEKLLEALEQLNYTNDNQREGEIPSIHTQISQETVKKVDTHNDS